MTRRDSTLPKTIKQKLINQSKTSHSTGGGAPEMGFCAPKKAPTEIAIERVATTGDAFVHWSNLTRNAMEWGMYLWRFLLWALHDIILSIWGIRILALEPSVLPCRIIEEELMVALNNLDCIAITPSDLGHFIERMKTLSADQAAIWGKQPWEDICHFIEQHTPSNILEQLHKPKLKVKSEAEPEVAMTISSFQERVLKRIMSHGHKVEKVRLGSAAKIQIELRETLPQVWKNIREDYRTSKLHALIIGINDYPNLAKLKGAVADADEVAKLLESELKVPPAHIINLRDGAATRQNIIISIKSLQNNPQINRGDPILIYYAGHGGVKKATDLWMSKNGANTVQVIFPFDYDNKDDSPEPIECIPDRTIAGLLNDLSHEKGDNITMIFDSGHSASGTRMPTKPRKGVLGWRERSAEVKRDIPWDIDSDIVRPERGIVPPPKDNEIYHPNLPLCTNQTSHIHLAACGSEEKAYEENGRGVFTMALLKSIRANGFDKITYHSLIKSLPSLSRSVLRR
ncbi:hypothetical protein FRC11_001807 [Ceratobasidium sp. 423]|nr:hypothetical protein FRC11_001807 [Ceratobasidium sp. 423]